MMMDKCSGRTESHWALIQDLITQSRANFLSPTSQLWFPAAGPILRAAFPWGLKKWTVGSGSAPKAHEHESGWGLALHRKPLWPDRAVCSFLS